jgi:hypothetical protein
MSGLSVEPNRGDLWFWFFPVEPPVRSGFFTVAGGSTEKTGTSDLGGLVQ